MCFPKENDQISKIFRLRRFFPLCFPKENDQIAKISRLRRFFLCVSRRGMFSFLNFRGGVTWLISSFFEPGDFFQARPVFFRARPVFFEPVLAPAAAAQSPAQSPETGLETGKYSWRLGYGGALWPPWATIFNPRAPILATGATILTPRAPILILRAAFLGIFEYFFSYFWYNFQIFGYIYIFMLVFHFFTYFLGTEILCLPT